MVRCKLNKSEYMKVLYENNQEYREGRLKIVEGYLNGNNNMIVADKYGLLKVMPDSLINGAKIDVKQALNKSEYTLAEIKDRNPDLYPHVKGIKVLGSVYHVNSKYGLVVSSHHALFKRKSFSILSARNPSDFWVRRNKDLRSDFDNIDYSKAVWENNNTKVKLRCKLHNYEYEQRPSHHIAGVQGCANCMKQTIMYTKENLERHSIFFENHTSFLYVTKLKNDNEEFYKVGITSSDRLQYRMNSLRKEYSALIEYCQEGLTVDMYNLEQRFLEEFRKYKYIPKKHFTGHTECLTVNPINF